MSYRVSVFGSHNASRLVLPRVSDGTVDLKSCLSLVALVSRPTMPRACPCRHLTAADTPATVAS